MCGAGSSAQGSVMTQRAGMRGSGGKVEEGGDICVLVADSCCCMVDANTIL